MSRGSKVVSTEKVPWLALALAVPGSATATLHWEDFFAKLQQELQSVTVSDSHGSTQTSASFPFLCNEKICLLAVAVAVHRWDRP